MTWQDFRRTTVRNPLPTVRVDDVHHSLRFNTRAAALLLDVEALVLMWDADRVAFRLVDLDDPDGYALYHQGAIAWVNCWSFLRFRGYAKRQAWTLHEDGDLLVGEPVRTARQACAQIAGAR